jgi:hypothetical protein
LDEEQSEAFKANYLPPNFILHHSVSYVSSGGYEEFFIGPSGGNFIFAQEPPNTYYADDPRFQGAAYNALRAKALTAREAYYAFIHKTEVKTISLNGQSAHLLTYKKPYEGIIIIWKQGGNDLAIYATGMPLEELLKISNGIKATKAQ